MFRFSIARIVTRPPAATRGTHAICDRLAVITLLFAAICVHFGSSTACVAAEKSLLHWGFDEGAGATTKDLSGNDLDGNVSAERVDSPDGKAVMMDGTSQGYVSVQIPEELRFGKDSWTFMAMLKPIQFDIAEAQNQRRIFAFGKYPDAYLVIDLTGEGRLNCYFCHKNANGDTLAASGSSGVSLTKNAWAHVALVCDRENRQIQLYVNGFPAGTSKMQADFDGDFVLGGQLTIGSGWHNYWGLVDEVKIFRTALSHDAVDAEFERLKPQFQVVESEAMIVAKRQARMQKTFSEVNTAWSAHRFDEVRNLCQRLVTSTDAPTHFRSYAHLRIAQSHLAEGNLDAAKTTYEAIAATKKYPAVHRAEGQQSAKEIEHASLGMPPRDPADSQTKLPTIASFSAELSIAPQGDDANAGTEQSPFASLERAREEVRALKKRGVTGPIAVTMMPGTYAVQQTLALVAEDSGSESGPIVYRSKKPGNVVLYGGKRLTGFRPVTDPAVLRRLPVEANGKVLQCDLRSLGIDDYGALKVRGFAQPPAPPTLELYVDGVPMTLARWPNRGFVGIRDLVTPGSKATGESSVIAYDSDRHERWVGAPDAWLFGYFHFLWADATIKVAEIDPKARTLTTAEPYHYGGRGMSTTQGIQYYAFNLLEEIDMPGEWYLERDTGVLYLYPPSDLRNSAVEIGMLSTPMITMDQVSHVRLEGLVFDLGRYNGIVMKDSNHCSLVGCSISRMAGNGVMIHGGRQNSLIGCDVHTIGRRATEVFGGDRATLAPGGHMVENCRIHNFGRIDRTYTPAIQLEGVGHRVAHNLMYNGPSSAMRIEGNDHLIEFNEVHSMVRESDDQGAMDLFRNPTYRGIIFRHNYFHNVGKTGTEAAVHGQAAIRFDDAISGMLVYGNVFYRSANGKFGAIQMNSGRDNLIDNNLFIDCKQGISGGWNPGNSVWKMLREGQKPAGFYQNERYLTRYPQITTMLDEPGINHIWRNVFYRCGTVATRTSNLDLFENGVFEDQNPGLTTVNNPDFRLRRDAPLFQTVGFQPIPFKEIGLYESPTRASWPVQTTPVAMPDWRESGKAATH